MKTIGWKSWMALMSSLHTSNWGAREVMSKGFLNHMLLWMKSLRVGEGEGHPAIWERNSAKPAITKYGVLLWGVYFSAKKKESKPVEFWEERLSYGISFKHLYVLRKGTRWHSIYTHNNSALVLKGYPAYSQKSHMNYWPNPWRYISVRVEREMLASVCLVWTDGFNCLK